MRLHLQDNSQTANPQVGDGTGKHYQQQVEQFIQPAVMAVRLTKVNNSLGLSIVAASPQQGPTKDIFGIYVKGVLPGGAAANEGSIEIGDQLLSVDGSTLVNMDQQQAAGVLSQTGQTVHLEVAKRADRFHGIEDILRSPSPPRTPAPQVPPKHSTLQQQTFVHEVQQRLQAKEQGRDATPPPDDNFPQRSRAMSPPTRSQELQALPGLAVGHQSPQRLPLDDKQQRGVPQHSQQPVPLPGMQNNKIQGGQHIKRHGPSELTVESQRVPIPQPTPPPQQQRHLPPQPAAALIQQPSPNLPPQSTQQQKYPLPQQPMPPPQQQGYNKQSSSSVLQHSLPGVPSQPSQPQRYSQHPMQPSPSLQQQQQPSPNVQQQPQRYSQHPMQPSPSLQQQQPSPNVQQQPQRYSQHPMQPSPSLQQQQPSPNIHQLPQRYSQQASPQIPPTTKRVTDVPAASSTSQSGSYSVSQSRTVQKSPVGAANYNKPIRSAKSTPNVMEELDEEPSQLDSHGPPGYRTIGGRRSSTADERAAREVVSSLRRQDEEHSLRSPRDTLSRMSPRGGKFIAADSGPKVTLHRGRADSGGGRRGSTDSVGKAPQIITGPSVTLKRSGDPDSRSLRQATSQSSLSSSMIDSRPPASAASGVFSAKPVTTKYEDTSPDSVSDTYVNIPPKPLDNSALFFDKFRQQEVIAAQPPSPNYYYPPPTANRPLLRTSNDNEQTSSDRLEGMKMKLEELSLKEQQVGLDMDEKLKLEYLRVEVPFQQRVMSEQVNDTTRKGEDEQTAAVKMMQLRNVRETLEKNNAERLRREMEEEQERRRIQEESAHRQKETLDAYDRERDMERHKSNLAQQERMRQHQAWLEEQRRIHDDNEEEERRRNQIQERERLMKEREDFERRQMEEEHRRQQDFERKQDELRRQHEYERQQEEMRRQQEYERQQEDLKRKLEYERQQDELRRQQEFERQQEELKRQQEESERWRRQDEDRKRRIMEASEQERRKQQEAEQELLREQEEERLRQQRLQQILAAKQEHSPRSASPTNSGYPYSSISHNKKSVSFDSHLESDFPPPPAHVTSDSTEDIVCVSRVGGANSSKQPGPPPPVKPKPKPSAGRPVNSAAPPISYYANTSLNYTPGVIGNQEVYRDPIQRRRNPSSQSPSRGAERLSFQDKMRQFAGGDENIVRFDERSKASSAQRQIENSPDYYNYNS